MILPLALLLIAVQPPPSADPVEDERLRLRVAVNCRIEAGRLAVERRVEEPDTRRLALNGAGWLSDAQLGCLASAEVSLAIEDSHLSRRYDAILERNVVRDSRRFLRDLGLLNRLPRRARRESLAGYASRLERLCGVPRWSLLRVREGRISIVAPGERETSEERRNWLCAVNAVVAAGYSVPPA